jgi:methylenetetrahydrofolate/methylenetetrahydromethanopterin dehydrogenase (NADP+)
VGRRVVRLLAREGATIRAGSRSLERSQGVTTEVAAAVPGAKITPIATTDERTTQDALANCELVIAAGAAGVELLSADSRRNSGSLRVAIDLNAVPPAGIGGIEPFDKGADHSSVICYGALGVGGTKMKIHKAAVRRLFEKNDLVLDADELYELGKSL